MPPIAYFGIESSGLSLVIDLLILFAVVLYLSLIYWTYADARRRIADPMLIACATAASLFPFVGTIVYMILRPPEYLEDVRERELDLQTAEARLHDLDQPLPALRLSHRARLRSLSQLPAQAQGALHELLAPARPCLDDLPVLRDGCAGCQAGAHGSTPGQSIRLRLAGSGPGRRGGRERCRRARAGERRRGTFARCGARRRARSCPSARAGDFCWRGFIRIGAGFLGHRAQRHRGGGYARVRSQAERTLA